MLVIAFFTVGIIRGEMSIADYWHLAERRDSYNRRVHDLETEVASLKAEIERLTHSKRYAKKVLRHKYNLLEENETVVFFTE